MHLENKIAEYKDLANNLQHNPPKSKWKFAIAAYFYTLVDIASAINLLYLHKDITSIPILFRSFLEAYFDLYNLTHDRQYGYRLEANKNKEWNRMLNNNNNPYLQGVLEDEEWKAFIEKLKVDENKLTATAYNKFELAEQKDVYGTVYNELCSDAHNNLRSVYARFIKEGADSNKLKTELCMTSVLAGLDEAMNLLKKASISMDGFSKNEY